MGSRIHHGSNERQKGDQEFDHVGVRSGVGIKPKTNFVTTPLGIITWLIGEYFHMRMKISRIMKIWLKIQNSKRWLKNTYCFYFKSTGLPRREAGSDFNSKKDHVIWEGKKDSERSNTRYLIFFVKFVSFWSDTLIC